MQINWIVRRKDGSVYEYFEGFIYESVKAGPIWSYNINDARRYAAGEAARRAMDAINRNNPHAKQKAETHLLPAEKIITNSPK